MLHWITRIHSLHEENLLPSGYKDTPVEKWNWQDWAEGEAATQCSYSWTCSQGGWSWVALQSWTKLRPFASPCPAFLGRGIAMGKTINSLRAVCGYCWIQLCMVRNQNSQKPRSKCVSHEQGRSSTVYTVDGLSLRSYLGLQSVLTGILSPVQQAWPLVFHVAPG